MAKCFTFFHPLMRTNKSLSYQSNATWETVSGGWIYLSSQMLSKVSERPYLECELEIEIQSCLDAASSVCRQEERPLKRPSIITCPFSVSFGQGRFCEHEEEDISGEFDVWHIVVEWLFSSPYFYFCSDMPREPCAPEKCLLSPSGPSQDICGTKTLKVVKRPGPENTALSPCPSFPLPYVDVV